MVFFPFSTFTIYFSTSPSPEHSSRSTNAHFARRSAIKISIKKLIPQIEAPKKKRRTKHKGERNGISISFRVPIYNSYRGKLVGEELVRRVRFWPREGGPFVGAENRDSWGEDRWKECIGGVAGTGHQPA